MIRINLLPHRELKRQARQRQFHFMAAGTLVMALVAVLLVHLVFDRLISVQHQRNAFLDNENKKLDVQIAQIKKLKEQRRALLDRKDVVENLQNNRSLVAHLLDELAHRIPPGLYLSSITQKGTNISLQGFAPSNDRVADFMRNLATSPLINSPHLVETHAASQKDDNLVAFSLDAKTSMPGQQDSKTTAAGPKSAKPGGHP